MNPGNLARYYEKYDRMNYGGGLWTRMVESLDADTKLRFLPFKYSCGRYVNEAGDKIELKYQALSPALLEGAKKTGASKQELRWLEDEFLRRLLSEEMKHCPVDGILCSRELQDLVASGTANRLVQTVYALVQQCSH